MGLVETRVYTPLRIQTSSLTEEKPSWSLLVPLVSCGMGNCLDWPLRTVILSVALLHLVFFSYSSFSVQFCSCAAAFLLLDAEGVGPNI